MKIFAHHAHVFPKTIREDGTVEALLRLMDTCGIDQAVAFAPFYEFFKTESINVNRWLSQEIGGNDRLYGFGVIDFGRDDLEEQTREIFELGLKGIKIHPAFQRIKVDGEKAFCVYKKAEELGLVVTFHTGIHWYRIAHYQMLLFDEVAWHFPKLRFTLEHVGGYAFFKEAVAVLTNNRENVYAGLTSVFDAEMNRYWYLGEEHVKELIWQIGAKRCIFGLDFPHNQEEKVLEAMESIKRLPVSDEEREGILGGNLKRLLLL